MTALKDPTKDFAGYAAQLEEELPPASHELDVISREKFLERAKAEGWSESQADWIDKLAKQPLFQAVLDGVPGAEALDQAYAIGRRLLVVAYFDNALDEGKNRYTAFLTVIDLERQVAERMGEAPEDYSDDVLFAACRAVEDAAIHGLSSDDQIGAGYETIRLLSEKAE